MKTAEGGYRRGSALVALCALVVFVFFAISCGGSGTGQSGSRTEQATVTKTEPTITNERSATNLAPDRPLVDVKAVGSPSLVARLRREVLSGGLDADGDFVAWIDMECTVHFTRLSDKRQAVVPYEFCGSADGPGYLALLGSRAVWSVVGAGMSSAHATVFTAMFGNAEPHELTTGEGQCESDYCPFRGAIIDSSGGSLVFVFDNGAEAPRTEVWQPADGAFKRLRVTVESGLAVHGKELAVLSDRNIVELRRLGDGSLIRRWRALHPHGKSGEVALSGSLLVIQSDDQYSGGWIDLYETATGQLVRSIRGAADPSPQPFADGVVFFSDRRLVYVSTTAEPVTLATTRGDPVALAVSSGRAFWIEYGPSNPGADYVLPQRLYSLELRSTP